MSRALLSRVRRLERPRGGSQAVHVVHERNGDPNAQIAALIAGGASPDDLFVIIRHFTRPDE